MKVQNIPLDRIKVPEVRVTARYDEDLADNLEQNLRDMGQQEPIVVVFDGQDYHLVDGLHRAGLARERGDRTIPAVVQEGDAKKAMLLNLTTSHLKGKIHPGDVLAVIRALVEDEAVDSDELAKATGMSRDQVERYWRIAEASPVLQMAVQEGTVALGAAAEIARLPHHAIQEEMTSMQVLYKRPIRDIKATVDDTLQVLSQPAPQQQPLVREAAPAPSCQGCQREVPQRDLRPVGLCPSCYGQVYRLAHAPANNGAQHTE